MLSLQPVIEVKTSVRQEVLRDGCRSGLIMGGAVGGSPIWFTPRNVCTLLFDMPMVYSELYVGHVRLCVDEDQPRADIRLCSGSLL